ncbi:hypothetical protein CR513_09014, partial [Mucuna pruriens]
MADTTSKDEDDEEVNFISLEYLQIVYQELLSNSSTLSLGYKELKRKISKLTKDFESLENKILLKYSISPHDKSDLDFEKEKEIKEKSNIHLSNYRKFGRRSYDYKERLKGSSKPSRTNPKGSKKICVFKTMIILIAYMFSSRKKTPVMWVLMTHDGRRVYVPRPPSKGRRMGYLWRSLELLHIDLFGPTITTSLDGKHYGLLVVDNYSIWTRVMFLAYKDESFKVFSILCKCIQNEKGFTTASIRSGHGGEFENESFLQFYEEHGIHHNFSYPRTPQHNSVVERKNISLQQMIKIMLNDFNTPRYFWAEVVNTSCYF